MYYFSGDFNEKNWFIFCLDTFVWLGLNWFQMYVISAKAKRSVLVCVWLSKIKKNIKSMIDYFYDHKRTSYFKLAN